MDGSWTDGLNSQRLAALVSMKLASAPESNLTAWVCEVPEVRKEAVIVGQGEWLLLILQLTGILFHWWATDFHQTSGKIWKADHSTSSLGDVALESQVLPSCIGLLGLILDSIIVGAGANGLWDWFPRGKALWIEPLSRSVNDGWSC